MKMIKKYNKWILRGLLVTSAVIGIHKTSLAQGLSGGSTVAGTIPGSVSVNQHGGAGYSVSLNAPPGINGLDPKLILSYNSQSSGGLFGHGWSLSGFSAITRCSVTRDANRYPVTYGAGDRFCIDGKLLIPVSGKYGDSGTVYHTERESWVRFQAFYKDGSKTCGSGPCYFTATLKHGSTMTYGATADSRIEAVADSNVTNISAGSVRVWTVSRHATLNQNYIDYHYTENEQTGEYVPLSVLYGGNLTTGKAPQRAIELTFVDAKQSKLRYQGGAKVVHSKIINAIESCLANTPITSCSKNSGTAGFSTVAKYLFAINFNPNAQLNYLSSMQLQGSDGNVFAPTEFTYSDIKNGPLSFQKTAKWTTFFSENKGWSNSCQARTMGDFNGDGRLDLIGFGNNYTEFALSSGLPISDPQVYCLHGDKYKNGGCSDKSKYFSCNSGFNSENNPRAIGDVNGDGLYDIIGLGTNNLHVAISNGSGFDKQTNWANFLTNEPNGWSTDDMRTLADVNGDGRSDIIGFGNSYTRVGLSTGKSFRKITKLKAFFTKQAGFSKENGNPPMLGDVNGDNLIDVVGIKKEHSVRKVYVGLSNGDGFNQVVVWNDNLVLKNKPESLIAGHNPIFLTDLNGDQLADLVLFGNDDVYVSLSTGSSFSELTVWLENKFTYNNGGWNDSGEPGGTMRTFADINADGRADLIGFGNSKVHFAINTGSSFLSDDTIIKPITKDFVYNDMGYLQKNPRYPADVTGDGVSDLFGLGSNYAIIAVAPTNQSLLTSVTNGLGKKTDLCYQSISASKTDVVGECTTKDKADSVYSTLPESEFNPDDEKWCKGRCRQYNTPIFVVKSRTIKNGSADTKGYRYEYTYAGAIVDKMGYGFLGFRRSTEIDLQANQSSSTPGLKHVSYFRQAFPFNGELDYMQMFRVSDGKLIGQTNYTYNTKKPLPNISSNLVQIARQSTLHTSPNSDATYTVAKTLSFDNFGNIILLGDLGNIKDPSDDVYTKTSYNNDATNWMLGYPVDIQHCSNQTCTQVLNHRQHKYDTKRNVVYSRTYDNTNKVWLGTQFSAYDSYGNLLSLSGASWDAAGKKPQFYNKSTITYEGTFNTHPKTHTNALKQISTSLYDAKLGQIIQSTGINNVSMYYAYDSFGRPVSVYGPDSSGDKTLLASHTYETATNGMSHKIISTIDWSNNTKWTVNSYDALGRQYKKEAEADDGTIALVTCYQSVTQVSQSSHPYYQSSSDDTCESNSAKYWIKYKYDTLHRPSKITHADGAITDITYDIKTLNSYNRDYVERTDSHGLPEQKTITSYLDPENKVLKRVFPQQNGVSAEQAVVHNYDHLGRTVQTISPGGATSNFYYDSLSRVISTNNSDSGKTTVSYYKENGLIKSTTDSTGSTHSFDTYDAILRPTKESYVQNGDTRTIQYTYDVNNQENCYAKGRLSSVSDSNGLTHQYCYDALAKTRTAELGVDSKKFTIAANYDPMSRLTAFTFPDGTIMKRSYNIEGPLNLVELCQKGGSSCKDYAQWKNFSATGHPENLEYQNGVETTYSYNESTGHLSTLNAEQTSSNPLINKTYSWNTLGLLTKIQDNINDEYSMSYTLDAAGSLKQANIGASGSGLTLDYTYNTSGALTQKGDTSYTQYKGQKLIISETNGETTTYGYYANANLKTKTAGNTSWQYIYNGQDRLSSVQKTVSGSTTTTGSYVYDYKGSLVKRTDGEGVISYYISKNYDIMVEPNEKNAVYTKTLTSLSGVVAALSTSAKFTSQTLSLDNQGSQSANNLLAYVHTFLNINWGALFFIVVCAALVFFTLYVWLNSILKRNQIQSRFWQYKTVFTAFTPLVMAAIVLQLIAPISLHAQGLTGNGYPIAGKTLFFHSDHTGGTTLVTDLKGKEVTRIAYLPFGEMYQKLSFGPDDFRAKFAGQELNKDTGLYYFNARFYDPSIGQFIQSDNRVLGGPDIMATSYNRFAYAGNNPITYSDPSGHSFGSFMKGLGIGIAISLAIMTGVGAVAGDAMAAGAVGAYWGAESANHNMNPLKWNWKSGKTYGGLAAGFAVAEVGATLAVVAPELLPEEAGAFAVFMTGLGATAVDGFAQNSTFAALGGANSKEAAFAGLEGAAIGAGFQIAGAGVGAAASRVFSRTAATAAD
ncbi:MAG: RHS repeat-associated core domain-containing protein, partial [Leptospirales bacterium]